MTALRRIEALLRDDVAAAAEFAARALEAEPGNAHLHNAMGVIRARQLRWAEAETHYRDALRLAPRHGGTWSNLGNALTALGHDASAVAAQRRGVALQPDKAVAHYNLGISLARAERHAEAAEALSRSAAMGHPQARWNRARARLALGQWREGFADYEVRLDSGMVPRRPAPGARWQGEDFAGRTLLLLTEQGFGDTLWVLRYLPLVRARGGRVVMESKPELAALLAPLVDAVVPPGTAVAEAELHLHVCSLPGLFAPDIPPLPPLMPDAARVAALRPRIEGPPGLRVGLIWSGSVTFGSNHWRAAGLERFLRAARLPGLRLFSLQKGPPEAELAPHRALVTDLASHLCDFADTAAALSLLDLVVMTDSAVAHLAGAMGVPVWVLLGRAPHWLWLTGREDSPWYPSMRLFRQPPGPLAWDGVFDRVGEALMELAARP